MTQQRQVSAVEGLEQKSRRLEAEVASAQGARDSARRNLAKAFEQFVVAERLLGSARTNYTDFQTGVITDALHDIERLRLPLPVV